MKTDVLIIGGGPGRLDATIKADRNVSLTK